MLVLDFREKSAFSDGAIQEVYDVMIRKNKNATG